MASGGWKQEAGGWKLEAGGVEVGGWRRRLGIKSGTVFSASAPMSRPEGAFWSLNCVLRARIWPDSLGKGPCGSEGVVRGASEIRTYTL